MKTRRKPTTITTPGGLRLRSFKTNPRMDAACEYCGFPFENETAYQETTGKAAGEIYCGSACADADRN